MMTIATDPIIQVGLVEDQTETLSCMIAAVRSSADMRVLFHAASVTEATRALARYSPDVLLVDLGLPDGSGLEVIGLASRKHPACQTMVFSMFGDEALILASIEAGASGYLLKDTPGSTLEDSIRQVRSGGSPMSPIIARRILQRLRKSPPTADPAKTEVSDRPVPEVGTPALTERETEILVLISRGYTYAEVASLLAVSVRTIQTHIKHLYGKLGVHSRSEAVFEASKMGLLRGLLDQ
ncbi:MAG: response regulator transcription factor [Candidatus Contendobacter sp.]|nr:response regulator transcription factor [Candidatus Contendobacter sp.]